MIKKKVSLIFLSVCLALALILRASAPVRELTPFVILIPSGSAIGFQNSASHFVQLAISGGDLNSSTATLRIGDLIGQFRFRANESCILTVTHNVSNVRIEGIANPRRAVLGGSAVATIAANDNVHIYWNIEFEPILPVMFILGMIGLCSMVGGGFYGAHKIKKGDYYEGGRMALIYIAVGFGLFIAWVFMGA